MTTEQLEEQFGSVDEARSWVAAVYDATENWMAAVQWNQGAEGSTQLHDTVVDCSLTDCTHSTPTALQSDTSLSKLDTSKLFGWHSDTLTHAQRLLLCENMQLKTGATGMATDSSVLPGPTTVNARAVLNRGHRESAAVSNLNAACISAECSRLHAGAVVNAPLNASSALSLHVSPSESEQVPSVPTVSCGLEYPPCQSSDVLRGDLSPLNTCDCDGVPPIGVPPVSHHSSAFSESWGKILGLVAAPLVGNAVTVPPLQKRAVQCNAVSQSGSQSDTQMRVTDSQMILAPRLRDLTGLRSRDGGLSDGHTQLSATDGSCEPLDCQSPCELTKSKFGSSSSCGCAYAPIAPTALSPHPNAESLDNQCAEREKGSDSQLHACQELPEIIAALESDRSRLDSVDIMSRLVDNDTSSGDESESEDESRQADSTIDSARAQWKPTGKSVCALLHATDIGGRWTEVVAARLKQSKYRSGKNKRRELNRRSQLGILHEESNLIRNRIDTLTDAAEMHRHCLADWPTDSGLFLHRMQYLKSRKQMREAKRKHNQKERVQLQQQSKVLQSLEEEALANARVFDRYDSMLTAKGRDTLHGVPQVNVCGSLEARELKQPSRTVYRPKLQVQSNTPIVLYYVAYAGLLHALFFCADHVPEIAAVVNWQGSALVAMLSIVVMMAGTRLHNGAMIAAALLFAWQAVGASSLTLVGPLYYLSFFFPPFMQRVIMAAMATVITVFMVTRLILKSNTIAVRSVKKGVNYVKGTKHRRVQAAVNEKILKQFNSTYVEIELVDNPGTIVRALLDSGAALSVFSLRSVKRVWHKMKRTLRQTVAGDSMTAAGGGGMGPNVGLADLKFSFFVQIIFIEKIN